MTRFTLLAPLFLAACGAHFDPCTMPCPDDVPPHLCDCQPFEGGGGFSFAPDAPKPAEPPKPDVKPDPKPETPKPPSKPDHPKPEAPKHEPKGKDDDC